MPTSPKSATTAKRSYWVWGILGCSFLVLLSFAGCVAGIGYLGQRVYTETQKPVNEEEIIAALGDIPIYQPSAFDPELTRVLRGSTAAILPGNVTATHAAFSSPDSEDRVFNWYQAAISDLGYQSSDTKLGFIRQVQFHKGRDRLLVQLQKNSTGSEDSLSISLSRYQPNQSQEK